jgi:hypothetical protein
MERRQDSLVPSVLSAGTDPAHIPGLDGPTADVPQQQPEEAAPAAEETAEAPASGPDAHDEPAAEDAGPDQTDTDETDTEEPAAEDAAAEGPSFEATDRRGAILADGSGITFRLDDTEALIGWDEIGAVELGTAKFGRRFSVAVHTTKHRTFDGDVEAPSRKEVRTWTEEFDAVLDTWFDDGGAKAEPEDVTPAAMETTEESVEEKAAEKAAD